MEAPKIDKMTDQELLELLTQAEEIESDQKSGKVSSEEALEKVLAVKQVCIDTYNKDTKTPVRDLVWNGINDIVKAIEKSMPVDIVKTIKKSMPVKFESGATLDLEARTKIQETKRVVRAMRISGTKTLTEEELAFRNKDQKAKDIKVLSDEQHALIRINMLKNYGKYIDETHPEMKALRQLYHDTCLENYEKYANSADRILKRDESIAKKIKENLSQGKYSNPVRAQAIVNVLEKVVG